MGHPLGEDVDDPGDRGLPRDGSLRGVRLRKVEAHQRTTAPEVHRDRVRGLAALGVGGDEVERESVDAIDTAHEPSGAELNFVVVVGSPTGLCTGELGHFAAAALSSVNACSVAAAFEYKTDSVLSVALP